MIARISDLKPAKCSSEEPCQQCKDGKLAQRLQEKLHEVGQERDELAERIATNILIEANASWLVWSNEHGAWWKSARRGYTSVLSEAGRYTKREADKICEEANKYMLKDSPYEVAVLAPDFERIECERKP